MHRVYKIDGIGDDQGQWGDTFTGMPVGLRILDGATADVTTQCADASGLVVSTTPITRDVLTSLPNLTVVTRTGVGVDSIDVAAATELGIQVTNVPDANHHEVATHALALILGGVRRISAFDTSVREHRALAVDEDRQPGRGVPRAGTTTSGSPTPRSRGRPPGGTRPAGGPSRTKTRFDRTRR